MKFLSQTFAIRTERGPQFIDITDWVEESIATAGLTNGFAVVFSKHTTAAIRINEAEPHLIADMEKMLCNMIPEEHDYAHNTPRPRRQYERRASERPLSLPAAHPGRQRVGTGP